AWAAGQAASLLPSARWEVACAPPWGEAEGQALAAAAAVAPAAVRPDPGLGAGLRIAAGGAAVDATLAGLARDRERLLGRLLARVEGGP
ncbi:MAG: hypothetical protein D6739_09010, partial [Nitrospirae bacterium]